MFVDHVAVRLEAGAGGAGITSFHREKGRPRGKPEGGSGGAGGDVVIVASEAVQTLLDLKRRPHRTAGSGAHGRGDNQHGRSGEDLVIPVPVGTTVRDGEGTLLADLAAPGQAVTVLRGGRGGRGNAALVGSAHAAPNFAEQGEYGEAGEFALEVKLLADAALIGFPNAGKSTLISTVSAARPKVADYPFTTLEPHLGIVEVSGREFVVADIPGLIEGAADGRGLGHEFLRHAERARALVVLLDPSALQETGVVEQHEILIAELGRHDPDLAARPRVVAVSKSDLPEAGPAIGELTEVGVEAHAVSAITGEGVEDLMHAVADAVEGAERQAPERPGYVLHRPAPPGFEVRRVGERWVVTGRGAERAIGLDDLTKPEAADLAAHRLAAAGIEDALRRAGAEPGDEVQIGDIVFEFLEENP